MLFLDGAYTFGGRGAAFHRARRPSNAELGQLLDTLSRRVVRLLERRGLLIADPECPALDFEAGSSLDQLQAASVHYRIAISPHAGRKALTLYSVSPMEERSNILLLAKVAGFSLHAAAWNACAATSRGRPLPPSGCPSMAGAGLCTSTNSRSGMGRPTWRWSRCQLTS